MQKTRIIIVEDEAIIAMELKSTLQSLGHQVVAHAQNGDRALDVFATTESDLVLLDINIKGTKSGIDLAHILKDKYQVPFIFLTSFSDRQTLDMVKETNPYGYIVKPFTESDLRVNIELAIRQYHLRNPSSDITIEIVQQKHGITLSEREMAVLTLLLSGKTYKEVGKELFISVNTVKTYQKRLFSAFSVTNRYELIDKMKGA